MIYQIVLYFWTRISIHAPRVGCDDIDITFVVAVQQISIHAPRVGCDSHISDLIIISRKLFQSTHPGWGATENRGKEPGRQKISIHAPRVGCDRELAVDVRPYRAFQSTHPGWGATRCARASPSAYRYFNPRTPGGVRPSYYQIGYCISYFNPRTPGGVRRGHAIPLRGYHPISIHAPRVGCDPRLSL